jgi:hypothetical protein
MLVHIIFAMLNKEPKNAKHAALRNEDFIVLDFFVGGIACGRKRCVREINVSRA